MESKWKHLKEKALNLRKRGVSMTTIENDLGIARSTLSHNEQKEMRLNRAREQAQETLGRISNNKDTMELALALLYLGEGFKVDTTGLGNSDPSILRFFLACMEGLYGIERDRARYSLHIRADQNPDRMKEYWSKELNVAIGRIANVSIDKRTIGRPSYPHYKGVCIANYGNVAIQRKLVYLGKAFCETVIDSPTMRA